VIGAAGAAIWRWLQRPPMWARFVCVAGAAALLLVGHQALAAGWLWRDVAAALVPGHTLAPVAVPVAARSVAFEVLAGPALLEAGLVARALIGRSLGAQLRRDQRTDRRRHRAVTGRRQLSSFLPDPHPAAGTMASHPPGAIRLGVDRETHRPLDLELPRDLAAHVFMPGVTGSGKTTTLARLSGGALANGYAVVIVDCKGGGLGEIAKGLADAHSVPFHRVDPDHPETLGYDPCSGDAASVANKLVGAFSYGPSAEIYKSVALEAIPVIVRGLQAVGDPVTLEALYAACGLRGMIRIAQRIPAGVNDRVRDRLLTLGAVDEDRLVKSGQKGLQRRFGALLEGKFGDLFRSEAPLDWDRALSAPSVTYVALSTLATSEDVELLGRVIAQDLKQVCARRLVSHSAGTETPPPVLAAFDEFAALREADQLSDLLRQARQARMSVVVSTQYIPENIDLRKSVLGAGLLLCHRLESEDANALAEALGTETRLELTNQLDFETGYTQKGSVRHVQAYRVHPNTLRELKTGYVGVRAAMTSHASIVQIPRMP
jgi:hypothetical protein